MATYYYPPSVQQLIEALTKLPGVGPKTGQRLAMHLLQTREEDALGLAQAIEQARSKVRRCRVCGNLYLLLYGALSPMEGIGPNDLNIASLLQRLQDSNSQVQEVIMACNTGVEGEATALYLARQIKPLNIKVSRLAYGVAVGGDLEYTDEATLSRALQGRLSL